MVKTLGIRARDLKEVGTKVLSIATISVGSWFFYDKFREWIGSMNGFDQYWWLIAGGLLYLGLVIFDLDKNGGG